MKKISVFQIVVIAIFVIFIIGGVAAFALYKGKSANTSLPTITVWGTFPANTFNAYVSKVNSNLAQAVNIRYVQKSSNSFSQEFTTAVARGTAPDVILIQADMILPQEDKLTQIPYTFLPQRTFIDSYVQEATLYLGPNGILALPFTIDPLVMYWNRDTFNSAGIAVYPRTWDEFTGLAQKLTVKDTNGNIRKSAIAMGTFSNIVNAREIFGSLLLQLGNPVTAAGKNGLVSTIKSGVSLDSTPAIQFFTKFVDPSDPSYSWNRSLPDSKSAFLSGALATYFGFASELADLRAKNPNLNFDVAALPQLKGGGIKAAYARMYGFSFVRTSPNLSAAYQIISTLLDPTALASLSSDLYLPPVRIDLIAQGSKDPYVTIFDQAALISRSWIDADPAESGNIFGDMIESITSGRKTIQQAMEDAGGEYNAALAQAVQ